MCNNKISGVIRTCGVVYHFEITQPVDVFTREQHEVYCDVFKTVANQVIDGQDAIIRSGDELDVPQTVNREVETPNVVVRLQLSSIREVPETLLAMMAETIVTGFSLMVDASVSVTKLALLGIVGGAELMSLLAGVNVAGLWSGDAATAMAAFDMFIARAKVSGAFDDDLQ